MFPNNTILFSLINTIYIDCLICIKTIFLYDATQTDRIFLFNYKFDKFLLFFFDCMFILHLILHLILLCQYYGAVKVFKNIKTVLGAIQAIWPLAIWQSAFCLGQQSGQSGNLGNPGNLAIQARFLISDFVDTVSFT